MTLEAGNSPNFEVNPNAKTTGHDPSEVLLADASGTTGTSGAQKPDDNCKKPPPPAGAPTYTPDVWTGVEAAEGGAAIGAVLGAAYKPVIGSITGVGRSQSARTVNRDTPDLIDRRGRLIAHLGEQINNQSVDVRIQAARSTVESPLYNAANDDLLRRYAPGNNLDATNEQVRQFLSSSTEQILDPAQLTPSFLTTAHGTEIGNIRSLNEDVQQNRERAARVAQYLGQTSEQMLDPSNPIPANVLTAAQATEIGDIRNTVRSAETDERRAADIARYLGQNNEQILDPSNAIPNSFTRAQTLEINGIRDTARTAGVNERRAAELTQFLGQNNAQILNPSNVLPSSLTDDQRREVGDIRNLSSEVQQSDNLTAEADRFLAQNREQILNPARPLPSALNDEQRENVRLMRDHMAVATQQEQTANEAQRFLSATRDQILDPKFKLPTFLSNEQREAVDQMRRDRDTATTHESEDRRLTAALKDRKLAPDRRQELEVEQVQSKELARMAQESLERGEQTLRGEVEKKRDGAAMDAQKAKTEVDHQEHELRTNLTEARNNTVDEAEAKQVKVATRLQALKTSVKTTGDGFTTTAEAQRAEVTNRLQLFKTTLTTQSDTHTIDAQGKRADVTTRLQRFKTLVATAGDAYTADARTETTAVTRRIQQLKVDVRTDHDGFTRLRQQIVNVDQAEAGRWSNLRSQLEQTDPTQATPRLASLLASDEAVRASDSRGTIGIKPEQYNRFTRAYTLSGVDQPPQSFGQRMGNAVEASRGFGGRVVGGGIAGAIVGGVSYAGWAAGRTEYEKLFGGTNAADLARNAGDCVSHAKDLLQNESKNGPTKEQNYDFGSQAIAALYKSETVVQTMPPDERRNRLQEINQQKEDILEAKHDMRRVKDDLAASDYMQDPDKRMQIGVELNNAVHNAITYYGQPEMAKAYRDVAVWDMAHIDIINSQQVTDSTSANTIEQLRKEIKDNLNAAESNDRRNKDLAQLQDMASRPPYGVNP